MSWINYLIGLTPPVFNICCKNPHPHLWSTSDTSVNYTFSTYSAYYSWPHPQHPVHGSNLSRLTIQIRTELSRINARMASVKSCADQLCEVIEVIFNLYLKLGRGPQLWKKNFVWYQCQKPHIPKTSTDTGCMALPSHLMKTLERPVLAQLRSMVSTTLGPIQFT